MPNIDIFLELINKEKNTKATKQKFAYGEQLQHGCHNNQPHTYGEYIEPE